MEQLFALLKNKNSICKTLASPDAIKSDKC